MGLSVYNSMTRRKEVFEPLVPGHVGMYVCGPTVYSHSHIGHAKSYISFDVIVRYLRHLGFKVLYVQNITDVGHLLDDGEDRMLRQSKIEQTHPMQIAENITRSYFADMDALGIVRPDISPRASGHIIEQIEIVKSLLQQGYAYEVNGSVYFNVRKADRYGKLSGRILEETVEGTRVELRDEKRNPEDFALWKFAQPEHIMRWPSPWGEGFPGWHVECSAMSMKYLGETFDIHGGGLDNQFPHHECEIAQSESHTHKTFARYWIHNNLVTVNGQKMSKSLGNFVSLKDAFEKFDPLVVRFFVLQSHYRSTLDFSDTALSGSRVGFEKLQNTYKAVCEAAAATVSLADGVPIDLDMDAIGAKFMQAMDDDFNAPQAIAVLFDLSRELNVRLNSGVTYAHHSWIAVQKFFELYAGSILGILHADTGVQQETVAQGAELVNVLIDVRAEAKKAKLWTISDLIRDRLKAIGIALEDKKDGTVWKQV